MVFRHDCRIGVNSYWKNLRDVNFKKKTAVWFGITKNWRKITEVEDRNRKDLGLLCQNHHYQLGKGFCFSKFYCSYRFSHLKTYFNEGKLAK